LGQSTVTSSSVVEVHGLSGSGADILIGGDGRDVLFGCEGDDVIFGGIVRTVAGGPVSDSGDFIDGGRGNDIIYGDSGTAALAPGSVSVEVWNDLNGDGLREAPDSGQSGAHVHLWDSVDGLVGNGNDIQIGEGITGTDGVFRFNNVAPGLYYAAIDPLVSRSFTLSGVGNDRSIDSDVEVTTGRTALFGVGPGQSKIRLGAGLRQGSNSGDEIPPIVVRPIGFVTSNYSVGEGDGYATITVARPESTGKLTLLYVVSSSDAKQGVDFESARGFLEFGDGERAKTFQVKIIDDSEVEAPEKFNLTLRFPSGGPVSGETGTATVTIIDNDRLRLVGRVYEDIRGNGAFDASDGDHALAGVSLLIVDSTGTVKRVRTNTDGLYRAEVAGGVTSITLESGSVPLGSLVTTGELTRRIESYSVDRQGPEFGLQARAVISAIVPLSGGGNDSLFGGPGDDLLVGGDGNDSLDGGHWLGPDLTKPGVPYDARLLVINGGLKLDPSSLPRAASIGGKVVLANGESAANVSVNLIYWDDRGVERLLETLLTNAAGAYSFSQVPTGRYVLEFTSALYQLSPNTVADVVSGRIQEINLAAGEQRAIPKVIVQPSPEFAFRFERSSYSVYEAAGSVTLTIIRSPGAAQSGIYALLHSGTATSGNDFSGGDRQLVVFEAGSDRASLTIPILADNLVEGEETFTVELRSASGRPVPQNGTATVTIYETTPSADHDVLRGGFGDDVYRFRNNWGANSVEELANQGNDQLDFSALRAGHNLVVDNRTAAGMPVSLTITDDLNRVLHAGQFVEKIIGGAGDDLFNIRAAAASTNPLELNLDGGAGSNTLHFDAERLSSLPGSSPIQAPGRQSVSYLGFQSFTLDNPSGAPGPSPAIGARLSIETAFNDSDVLFDPAVSPDSLNMSSPLDRSGIRSLRATSSKASRQKPALFDGLRTCERVGLAPNEFGVIQALESEEPSEL
jgi:hypothetical protein